MLRQQARDRISTREQMDEHAYSIIPYNDGLEPGVWEGYLDEWHNMFDEVNWKWWLNQQYGPLEQYAVDVAWFQAGMPGSPRVLK